MLEKFAYTVDPRINGMFSITLKYFYYFASSMVQKYKVGNIASLEGIGPSNRTKRWR